MWKPIRDAPFRLIQSEAGGVVKRALSALFIGIAASSWHPAASAEELPRAQPPFESKLPAIEVKKFDLRAIRKTRSHRTYLFEDVNSAQPRSGKVLLLKSGDTPILAFRVLHVYAEAKRIAARKILRYGDANDLEDGSTYLALQKLADIYPIPVLSEKEKAQDQAELKELEAAENLAPEGSSETPGTPGEPPAITLASPPSEGEPSGTPDASEKIPGASSDPNSAIDPSAQTQSDPTSGDQPAAEGDPTAPVDSSASDSSPSDVSPAVEPSDTSQSDGTSTDLTKKNQPASEEAFIDENDDLTLHSAFIKPLDPGRHWISLQWALLRNTSSSGGSIYQAGIGVRYGLSLVKRMFFRGAKVQDSLTPEVSVFSYKLIDFEGDNNSYSVTPLSFIGRYNLQIGESFGAFIYAGFVNHFVSASGQSNPDTTAALSRFAPALGVGFLAQLGPHWDLRIDGGIDMFGLGLVLRF